MSEAMENEVMSSSDPIEGQAEVKQSETSEDQTQSSSSSSSTSSSRRSSIASTTSLSSIDDDEIEDGEEVTSPPPTLNSPTVVVTEAEDDPIVEEPEEVEEIKVEETISTVEDAEIEKVEPKEEIVEFVEEPLVMEKQVYRCGEDDNTLPPTNYPDPDKNNKTLKEKEESEESFEKVSLRHVDKPLPKENVPVEEKLESVKLRPVNMETPPLPRRQLEVSQSEDPREFLLNKRASLAHKSDIEKLAKQEEERRRDEETLYEFQNIKLKHVNATKGISTEAFRKLSREEREALLKAHKELLRQAESRNSSLAESVINVPELRAVEPSSKDMIVNLTPAPLTQLKPVPSRSEPTEPKDTESDEFSKKKLRSILKKSSNFDLNGEKDTNGTGEESAGNGKAENDKKAEDKMAKAAKLKDEEERRKKEKEEELRKKKEKEDQLRKKREKEEEERKKRREQMEEQRRAKRQQEDEERKKKREQEDETRKRKREQEEAERKSKRGQEEEEKRRRRKEEEEKRRLDKERKEMELLAKQQAVKNAKLLREKAKLNNANDSENDGATRNNSDDEIDANAEARQLEPPKGIRGGFLAPTKAWLLHVGESVEQTPKVAKPVAKTFLKAKTKRRVNKTNSIPTTEDEKAKAATSSSSNSSGDEEKENDERRGRKIVVPNRDH